MKDFVVMLISVVIAYIIIYPFMDFIEKKKDEMEEEKYGRK